MKVVSTLYTGKADFQALTSGVLSHHGAILVRIYPSCLDGDEAVLLAREIKDVLPDAKIIGCSASGVVFNAKQYNEDTLVVVECFESAEVYINIHNFEGKSAIEVAKEITSDIAPQAPSLMHIFCGEHYYDVHNFIEYFNHYNQSTKLIGGVAGDILPRNISAYVFTENGVVPNGIISAAITDGISIFTSTNISHEPISAIYRLGHCDGSAFTDIEGTPAVQWCQDQLGLKQLQEYDDWQVIAENDDLIRFPLILEGHGGSSRFIKYDATQDQMSLYFSQLNDGTSFRIGYCSPIKCVQEAMDTCNQIKNHPVESFFCYSCLFRKLYLGNCAEWELSPFAGSGICGAFMMGEVGPINGRNEFLNGTSCLIGIADTPKFIEPDFGVFEDLYRIKNENETLLNFVLQKQSNEMSRENRRLMERLLEQQEHFKEQLYTDANTGLRTAIGFLQDQQLKPYDKMCFLEVENFELLFARFGQQSYQHLIKQFVDLLRAFLAGSSDGRLLELYLFNDSTLFLTTGSALSDDAFMNISKKLFEHFRIVRPGGADELLVNRFVITMHKDNLLEQGLSALENSRNLQNHFIVYDREEVTNDSMHEEMNMLHILDQVIQNKDVIPYFQGIYDNNLNKIVKYEALMRIKDENGKLYPPAAFMDVAKKYHMYMPLSAIMIEKVFELFADRDEEISINLSIHDIAPNGNRDVILEHIKKVKNPRNFIFEILEDESFKSMDLLRDFIEIVRVYGARIAIDDFGIGYSNFMEIAKVGPDFIKVDGSIVRDILDNSLSQKVLQNISFLGKQLDAQLIAEFVETENIYNEVHSMGIHFSQGYYFARPTPFDQLGLK